MRLCDPQQVNVALLVGKTNKILEIAGELYDDSTVYREALFTIVTKYECTGRKFNPRSKEALLLHVGKMLKNAKPGHLEPLFLLPWLSSRLNILCAEDVSPFELSSWKDILFVYQLAHLLKLNPAFGPSEKLVLEKFESVSQAELARLKHNAEIMIYGLEPLCLDGIIRVQENAKTLASGLAGQSWDDGDWATRFDQSVADFILLHETMVTQTNRIRNQLSKLVKYDIFPDGNNFLNLEGFDFFQNVFSQRRELRDLLVNALIEDLQETIDLNSVQQFFTVVSETLKYNFPHDHQIFLTEFENLVSTQDLSGTLAEKTPCLAALMQVCKESAPVDRDDVIWEDFTGKFSRALAERQFSFQNEVQVDDESQHELVEENCSTDNAVARVEEFLQPVEFDDESDDTNDEKGFDTADCDDESSDYESPAVDEKEETIPLLTKVFFADERLQMMKGTDSENFQTVICNESVDDNADDFAVEHGVDSVGAGNAATHATGAPDALFAPICNPKTLSRQLVEKGQIAALYWLTRSVSIEDVPSWLAELVYLGTNLRPGFVAAKERVGILIRQATKEVDSLSPASAMLLAAAALRPALMMPSNEQNYIFNALANNLQYNSKPLMERLAKFVTQNTPLDETIFLHQSQIVMSQEKRSQLRAQTQSFLDHAPKKTLVYAPATFAFRQLFNRNTGELGKVLQACAQEDFTLLRDLDLEAWARESFIYTKLNQLEKERNPLSTKAIDFKAREAFKRQVFIALGLLGELKRFEAPLLTTQSASYVQQEFGKITGEAKKFNAGLADVQDFYLRPFAVFLQENLKKLAEKFQSDDTNSIFLDPLEGLDFWLLNMPEFTLEGGQVSLTVDTIGMYVDESGKNPPPGLVEHICKGNFALVDKYFSVFPSVETEPCAFDSQKSCRAFFEEELSKQFRLLQAEMERINDRIEDYYLRGVIAEEKELELRGRAFDLERALEGNKLSIPEIRDNLEVLDRQLESSGEEQHKLLLADLEGLKNRMTVSDDILSFFEDCIGKNEISTAHEELAELQWKASNGIALALRDDPDDKKTNYAVEYFEKFLPNFKESNKPQKKSAEDTHQYIKDWHRLFSLTSIRTPIFQALLTQILRLIGFELEREARLEIRWSEGSPYYWQVFKCPATIRSPLSKWGSEARGEHYIVYTPDGKVQPSELGKFLDGKMRKGELNKSTPITVFTQVTYGMAERKKLIKIGQQMNYMPLVVDTPIFYWLLGFDSQERAKALFESGLAGAPFNPYTPTVAGAVPSEMFYGRERDIERLWDPTGPCIVYGGRQLGKSALLKRVTHLYNKPFDGQYVRYEDVRSESDIVDVVLRSLKSLQIVNKSISVKGMSEAIKQFLNKNPSSRILLLLDECDFLIKSDMAKPETPGLSAIRGIMTDTNRRFKVILAGLESVQRYSHLPNTPFPHYGLPLCVGPLQPKPARELVEEPMAAIGLYFESPELIQRVLVHTNHNPSLIQLFCYELVGAMHERASTGEGKFPRKISKEIIAQVYRRANLRTQIRERFEWTLELDPRYKVTGYTLALMQEYSQGAGMGRGFRTREILSELADYWPQAFANASKEEVGSILTEMEGLGIVLKLGDTYRLRSPNIINLLGGSGNIMDELSIFANKPYDNGKALDMRPVLTIDGSSFSSPLALSQINEIKMSKTGLVLVTGSKALGLDRVGKTLQYVSKYDIPVRQIKGINAKEILFSLKDYYNKIDNAGCLAWFDCDECSDFVRTVSEIHRWLGQLHTDKKYISVVALVGTKDVLDLFIDDKVRHIMESPFVRHLPLGKWSESGVNEWFHNQPEKLTSPNSIISRTGGWDYLVIKALDVDGQDIGGYSKTLTRDFFMPQHPSVHKILETYREWNEPMSGLDFWELLQDNPLFNGGEKYLESVLDALVILGVFSQVPASDNLVLDVQLAEYMNGEVA